MKSLTLLGFLFLAGGLVAAPSAEEVAQLKRDFPKHIAPGSVEKMHPITRQCFEQFSELASQLHPAQLSKQSLELANAVSRARSTNQGHAKDEKFVLGHAGREAARLNVRWIDQKVLPWAKRVVEVARK